MALTESMFPGGSADGSDPWPEHLKSVPIDLTLEEARTGAVVGFKRCFNSYAKGRTLEPGRSDWGFDRHVRGAQAEIAVARYLGLTWDPEVVELDNGSGDGMPGIQVKSVSGKTRRSRFLEVRPWNPIEHVYVLVIVNTFGRFELAGWINGRDARRAGTTRMWDGQHDERNSYIAVPKSALHPMNELQASIAER